MVEADKESETEKDRTREAARTREADRMREADRAREAERERAARRKWIAIAIAAAVGVTAVLSWGKCDRKPDDPAQTMKTEEAPLPAPAGLIADLTIATPNASWGKIQRGIGGAVGILPASAGGIICAAAGLDPFISSEIDGSVPMYGAVAGDPARAGFVLAMKLSDLRKARGVLVDGDTARYATRDTGGMTELLPKGQGSPPSIVLAISPNGYLLLARRSEDLTTLGAYVTRTLPRRRLPEGGSIVLDVGRTALGSLVKPKLEELWSGAKGYLLAEDERMRRDHGGRAPDFGDPKAIVGAVDAWVSRRIAVFGDLEKMRVALDPAEDGISIVTTLTPAAGGGVASKWTDAMKIGDLGPLGSLPAASAVALLVRDGEEERADQGRELEKTLTSSLGPRLAEGDAKKLHDVFDDFTKARGDVLTSALVWDEPQGLSLRIAARDAEAATRAVKGAIELVKVAPFKELLRVREVTTSTDELAGAGGKASNVTIAREPGKDGGKDPRELRGPKTDAGAAAAAGKRARKDDLGIAWLVDGGVLTLATSDTPLATLGGVVRPEKKLGDEPSVARSFKALGGDASAVLVVQPLRFDAVRAHMPAAPLVIALGRKEKNATLRIDVANGLLRELARRQLGL